MTHGSWIRLRVARSVRVRLGVLLMSVVALSAVFAELIAADAPWLASGPNGIVLFPTVVEAESYAQLSPQQIEAKHAQDFTLWPLVHQGPRSIARA